MKLKQMIPLAAAMALGLVALLIAKDMNGKKTPAGVPIKMVQVVVAKGPLAPGQAFTAEQLDLQKIPGEVPPDKALTSIDEAVGRVSLVPIFDGQPLRSDFLTPKGTPAGLAPLIPAGMRAITIDVNETSSVAGMLIPGSHVDIVSTLSVTDANKPLCRTVAQDIQIIAVGQRLSPVRAEGDKSDPGYRTVTLLAKPHEAELIELACNSSRTRLVLRGLNDDGKVDGAGVAFVELLGHHAGEDAPIKPLPVMDINPTTRPAEMPQTQHHVTQVIRAGSANNVDFELPLPDPASMTDTDSSSAITQ